MSGAGWAILGIIYFVLLVVFAVLSFRKGHWVLGLIGFIFPILWIIGAILPSKYATRRPGRKRPALNRLSGLQRRAARWWDTPLGVGHRRDKPTLGSSWQRRRTRHRAGEDGRARPRAIR